MAMIQYRDLVHQSLLLSVSDTRGRLNTNEKSRISHESALDYTVFMFNFNRMQVSKYRLFLSHQCIP